MSEWISVKDKLPDSSDMYLIFYDNACCAAQFSVHSNSGGRWFDYECNEHVYPTHWMHLPDGPE